MTGVTPCQARHRAHWRPGEIAPALEREMGSWTRRHGRRSGWGAPAQPNGDQIIARGDISAFANEIDAGSGITLQVTAASHFPAGLSCFMAIDAAALVAGQRIATLAVGRAWIAVPQAADALAADALAEHEGDTAAVRLLGAALTQTLAPALLLFAKFLTDVGAALGRFLADRPLLLARRLRRAPGRQHADEGEPKAFSHGGAAGRLVMQGANECIELVALHTTLLVATGTVNAVTSR